MLENMKETVRKTLNDYVAKKALEDDHIFNVVIRDMNLANMDLSHKSFDNCLFVNCKCTNFNGSNFSGAFFLGVNFENCNLNNCILNNSSFFDCNLKMNYINNSNFTNSNIASLHSESTWYTNHFKNTSFKNAYLAKLKLDNSDFRNADFTFADFYKCEVENCDFRGATLPQNIFDGYFNKSNLKETNFETIFTHNVDFQNIKKDTDNSTKRLSKVFELEDILKEHKLCLDTMGAEGKVADLSFVDLSWINLSNYDLNGVNLQGANLHGTNLSNCNLEGANLEGANLKRANLENASLEGANLKNANLMFANLTNTSFNDVYLYHTNIPNTQELDLSKARTPEGFVSEEFAKEILGRGTGIYNVGGEKYAINPEKSNNAILIGQDYYKDLLGENDYVKSFAFEKNGDNIIIDKKDTRIIDISDALYNFDEQHHIDDLKKYGEYDENVADYTFSPDTDWDKIRKVEAKFEYPELLKQEDFHSAYRRFARVTDKDTTLSFMKEVVKEKGANIDIINKAINTVVDIEGKWNEPQFQAKLLQNTLKTDEYKKAFEAGQSKTVENVR